MKPFRLALLLCGGICFAFFISIALALYRSDALSWLYTLVMFTLIVVVLVLVRRSRGIIPSYSWDELPKGEPYVVIEAWPSRDHRMYYALLQDKRGSRCICDGFQEKPPYAFTVAENSLGDFYLQPPPSAEDARHSERRIDHAR